MLLSKSIILIFFPREDEDIDESARGTASITTFFAQKDAPKTVDHCKFFIERHLAQCVDL